MTGGKKYDRKGSGPYWWLALVVIVFALYSMAVAGSTAEDCGDRDKHWEIFPPAWECETPRGVG